MYVINNARKSKQAYKSLIQDAIVYFVNEYNGALSYNSTPFKEIVQTVGKDVKDLRNWLFTYTNLTKVNSDLLHFETSEKVIVTNKEGKKFVKYTLKFNSNFNGQTWYDTAQKTDEDAIKEFTSDNVKKSLIALYSRYMKDPTKTYDSKEKAILDSIKTAYKL